MNKQSSQQIIVSIVFSNYNGGNEPIECLRSIGKLNFPKNNLEVIVIDNGSQDGSKEKIIKLYPKTKIIGLKKDIGLPASLNLGINKSRGQYIMIANDDIVFEKNSLKIMVNYLEQNIDAGVLGGKVFYKDQPKKLSLSACDFNMYKGEIKSGLAKGDQIKWLQSCAIMVPRTVFSTIGLFDPDYYPLYFDDFDFCLRATKANLKIIYLKDAIFWHGGGKTTQKFPSKNVYYWWYKNKIRFYIKHATLFQIIPATLIQICATFIKSMTTKQNLMPTLFKAFTVNFSQLESTIASKKKNVSIKQ